MKLFFESPSSVSHAKVLLRPGLNDLGKDFTEDDWELALKRSKYLRTLVDKGKIYPPDDKPVEYELEDLSWNKAQDMIQSTKDVALLQRWQQHEQDRAKPRKSVLKALTAQIETLES